MRRDERGLAARIGGLAAWALREEAGLAPKPGLVDPAHSGAHSDMDYPLLLASADAIEPFFAECAAIGGETRRADPREILAALRPVGLRAERAMMEATGGVNAHRGAIFCLGLLSAGAGRVLGPGPTERETAAPGERLGDRICGFAAAACRGMVAAELSAAGGGGSPRPATAGERLFASLGARGARGEAEDGYPVVRERILPILRSARTAPSERSLESIRIARLDALLASISALRDSCLLARGGVRALERAMEGASRALAAGGAGTEAGLAAIRDLDATLCAGRWSPGGSADMLAAGIFLERLEGAAEDGGWPPL